MKHETSKELTTGITQCFNNKWGPRQEKQK